MPVVALEVDRVAAAATQLRSGANTLELRSSRGRLLSFTALLLLLHELTNTTCTFLFHLLRRRSFSCC